jgi:hypothetical protein
LTNANICWLDHLSNQISSRLSGSANADKELLYKEQLETLGFDKYSSEVMVPKWVRGEKKQPIS